MKIIVYTKTGDIFLETPEIDLEHTDNGLRLELSVKLPIEFNDEIVASAIVDKKGNQFGNHIYRPKLVVRKSDTLTIVHTINAK